MCGIGNTIQQEASVRTRTKVWLPKVNIWGKNKYKKNNYSESDGERSDHGPQLKPDEEKFRVQ